MSVQTRIGTEAETAVVRVFQERGWPNCERRRPAGAADRGDLTGIPGICVQVKGGDAARGAMNQPALIEKWLQKTEGQRQNAHADIGILVMARGGFGVRNAHKWWAVVPHRLIADLARGRTIRGGYPDWIAPAFMELGDLLPLLRVAGYGTPLEETA
jgi:hypothetical protein